MTRIVLTSPGVNDRTGNAVTAGRWSRILRGLGHRVRIVREYQGEACDLLVALHAVKSAASIKGFHRERPGLPIVLALTGTDLYPDLSRNRRALGSLDRAHRLVVLQRLGRERVPRRHRSRTVVIHQSARMPAAVTRKRPRHFTVALVANLRPVKDPMRAAMASRLLPPDSRVRILHAGMALSHASSRRAREEMQKNPRYDWRGELPQWKVKRLIARSRLLVLSSRTEGGANVISEAVVAGVPVLATRIDGNVGLLGSSYPGLFPVADTRALAGLLERAETDARFYARLQRHVRRLAPRFHPSREKAAWKQLLADLD